MAKGAGKARKKLPKELAVVRADNCTGCEACIEVCPVDCIYKVPGEDLPSVQIVRGHRPGALHRLRPVRALVPVGRHRHGRFRPTIAEAVAVKGGPPDYVAKNRERLVGRRPGDPGRRNRPKGRESGEGCGEEVSRRTGKAAMRMRLALLLSTLMLASCEPARRIHHRVPHRPRTQPRKSLHHRSTGRGSVPTSKFAIFPSSSCWSRRMRQRSCQHSGTSSIPCARHT